MIQNERVMITGGAGMIGHRTVRKLSELGASVAVLDNLSSGLPMPKETSRAVIGDIRNADLVSQLCRSFRPHVIIHLASVHHIPTCEKQRAYSLDVNVVGTENVLHAAEVAGVERVVIASSGAVYSWTEDHLSEDISPLQPRDNYSAAKNCNESQLHFWAERTGAVGRAARIFNTLGNDDPNAHLLPDILAQLDTSNGETTIRLGNLAPRRDYIHAEDVAAGLTAVAQDPRANVPFDTFNLCSGKEYSVEEFVNVVSAITGRVIRIEVDETRKRKVDRLSQVGSTAKAERLLNWHTNISFNAALERAIPSNKALQ